MVESNKICCGCGICESLCPTNAIRMEKDTFGFMLPKADESKCIGCTVCNNRCPMGSEEAKNEFSQKYYAAVSRDHVSLKDSASGGAFFVFAKKIIEEGGVVFGCILDDEQMPIITYAERIETLKKMQGSKYVEAEAKESFSEAKRFLDEGRRVLYSGTPCKVAALRQYLNKEYDKLVCCEIICHGVASRELFRDYLDYLSRKLGGRIISVSFRDKKKGWGNLLKITYEKDGKVREKFLSYAESSYYYYYVVNATYRESCYECPFAKINREGDITIGDFWGGRALIQNVDPDLGVSAIIVSSLKGQSIFNECLDLFSYVETEMETMTKENPNLLHPSERGSEADLFWKTYSDGGFEAVEKLHKQMHSKSILKEKIKRILPMSCIKIIRKMRGTV